MAKQVTIIGAGPAGLMAAEYLARGGMSVDIWDAMPSAGRKLLMAGRGGLNISHHEPWEDFVAHYGGSAAWLRPALQAMGPDEVVRWMEGLGIPSLTGSSGRIFPACMKAAPLLRAWLQRLLACGVRFHMRHRWLGWNDEGENRLLGPEGEIRVRTDHTLLALGGGSWSRLGSRGDWVDYLQARGVQVNPLMPANCGVNIAWSQHLVGHFAGAPIKHVRLGIEDATGVMQQSRGELVLTRHGLEGSCLYALVPYVRESLSRQGHARLVMDLLPDHDASLLERRLADDWGKASTSSMLKKRLGVTGVKAALLHEGWSLPRGAADAIAGRLKCLPVDVASLRPLDEAISTAGGIARSALDDHYRLLALPSVSAAGEMLDWEAPTGGYLLTACLATGRAAAMGIMEHQ